MKVREEMRIKQAIYGSSQAPAFVNGASKKMAFKPPVTTHSRSLVICHDWIMDDHIHAEM